MNYPKITNNAPLMPSKIAMTQPNFRTANSTPATMPLPHGMAYGGGTQSSGKVISSALGPRPTQATASPMNKNNADMAAHLNSIYGPKGPKSFGGKGWGGP